MDKLRNQVKDISHNYYKYLMALENVNGVAYGYKYINNKNTFEPCIHVLVKKKIDNKYVSSNNIIPKNYMGIKTDVIEMGNLKFLNIEPKERPLKGGCCIAQLGKDSQGTMCCIIKKRVSIFYQMFFQRKEDDYYILSNNHVLADFNKNPLGTIFTQPNTNTPEDIVARLDTYIPIKFITEDEEPINYVDCAIAKLTNNSLISDTIVRFGKINGVAEAKLGMSVKKYGFKSKISRGEVKSLHLTTTMKNKIKTVSATFKDQILADVFSEPGDSGSPILTSNNMLIGMGMAGRDEVKPSKFHSFVINDINLVLEYLNAEVYLSDIITI